MHPTCTLATKWSPSFFSGLTVLDYFVSEQVMEYHLQAIDELSIPNDSDVDDGDHLDTALPVTS